MRKLTKERIAKCIEENFHRQEFNVTMMSEIMKDCLSGIRDGSHTWFGVSTRELIEIRRLSKAVELLSTNIAYDRICTQCGYDSHGTFYRAFIKHFSLPPRLWRHKYERARNKSNLIATTLFHIRRKLHYDPFASALTRSKKRGDKYIV